MVKKKYDKTTKLYEKAINDIISNKNNWLVKLSNKNLLKDKRKVLLYRYFYYTISDVTDKTLC